MSVGQFSIQEMQLLDKVGWYIDGLHHIMSEVAKEDVECVANFITYMTHLEASLRLLNDDVDDYVLLNHWLSLNSLQSSTDIHQYIDNLWNQLLADRDKIEAIANRYFRRSLCEAILGMMVIVASPALLLLVLPIVADSLVLVPLFLAACIVLPLFSHFFLIIPAMKDYEAKNTFAATLRVDEPAGQLCRQMFFKDERFADLKASVAKEYQLSIGV